VKKLSSQEQILDCASEIAKNISMWKSQYKNGCSDPLWPDGANLNLLHNHVLYYKQKILELCEKNKLELPPEYFIPTPPYVDSNYFAKPNSKRAKRIKSNPSWECANHEPIGKKYDANQMSLI
jgi:hypothetical protein